MGFLSPLTIDMPAATTTNPSTNSPDPSTHTIDSQGSGSAHTDNASHKPISVNEAPSLSPSILNAAADCPVLKADGTKVPFKSLYWTEPKQRHRTLIIFIRHFFCGNCQEFVRSLTTEMPPASLPKDLSITIIGCGSPTLIESYITETACPYPIYTDPTKRLYDALGLHRTLSLGWKGPEYIQHTLMAGVMKSIVQTVKRFGAGDALSGGDMRLNGGEFLFDIEGPSSANTKGAVSKGNSGLDSVSVTWCHRMANSRNHSEVSQIRTEIGFAPATALPVRRRLERRWTPDTSKLRRSLSSRRESWMGRTNSVSRKSSFLNEGAAVGEGKGEERSKVPTRRRSPMGNGNENEHVAKEDAIREEVRSRDGVEDGAGVSTPVQTVGIEEGKSVGVEA